ncbi:MAG: cell division protein ZapA [Betaproteobacteria bacterium]
MKSKSTPPSEPMVTLDVSLLGHSYKIACKQGEEAELMDAVAFLDARMQEIRAHSKASSTERIAVMAALNLAHDFRRGRHKGSTGANAKGGPAGIDAPEAQRRIASMRSAIDQALAGQEKLL